jgi:arabinogalactan oligomer/maltooligosaccharide transport system substrate-binding protein
VLNPNLTGDLAKAAFNAGKSPYFLSGPWNVPTRKAGIVSVDAIPSAGGGRPSRSPAGVLREREVENALARTSSW